MFLAHSFASSSPPPRGDPARAGRAGGRTGQGQRGAAGIRRSQPRSRTARAPSFSRQLLVKSELTPSWRCGPTTWPGLHGAATTPSTPRRPPDALERAVLRHNASTAVRPDDLRARRRGHRGRRQRTDRNGSVGRAPLGRRRIRRRGDSRVHPRPRRPRAGARKAPLQSPILQLTVRPERIRGGAPDWPRKTSKGDLPCIQCGGRLFNGQPLAGCAMRARGDLGTVPAAFCHAAGNRLVTVITAAITSMFVSRRRQTPPGIQMMTSEQLRLMGPAA